MNAYYTQYILSIELEPNYFLYRICHYSSIDVATT